MSSNREGSDVVPLPDEIFKPLGVNRVYSLPNVLVVPPPEYLLDRSRQPDEAAQWAILRMGRVMDSFLHSEGYVERIIIHLPGCIAPAVYDTRLRTLGRNLVNAPQLLARAVETEDWVLCRYAAQDRLIPSCLQVVMNGVWKDSFTRTAAACGPQTCWTALWHILVAKACMFWSARILPALHQRFDAELNIIIARLIQKCEATLEIGPGRDPPVDVFFDLYLVNITAVLRRII